MQSTRNADRPLVKAIRNYTTYAAGAFGGWDIAVAESSEGDRFILYRAASWSTEGGIQPRYILGPFDRDFFEALADFARAGVLAREVIHTALEAEETIWAVVGGWPRAAGYAEAWRSVTGR